MRRPGQGPAGARGGTTLVEVIIGCLILAVLALAAMASLQYTRSMTVQQRDRRTALELANGRLEALRGALFNSVRPTSSNYNVYYLRSSGTTWVVSSSATSETVTVNYRPRPLIGIITKVDSPHANIPMVRQWMENMGCERIFMVNNKTREGISELMDYLKDDLPKLTLEQAKFKQSIGLNKWDPMPEGVEYPESIR